ncbi:hypothetical protein BJP39_06380 [Streptomyces sp. CC77]|nr:hypothetical protein BJP39_06380 [Streptomyces sp. CC77]
MHRISRNPDAGETYEAKCLRCDWSVEPSPNVEAVDLACLRHAGRSGHKSFRRVVTSFAFVVRAE